MSSPVTASRNASSSTPTITLATGATSESLDHWLEHFQTYETILAGMVNVSTDSKFKDKLITTEQWFKVLAEPERTALVYTLLQHSTREQVQFFSTVLQQMKPKHFDGDSAKPKSTKTGIRPPSLYISSPGSPAIPVPNSDSDVRGSVVLNMSKHTSAPASPLPRPDNSLRIPGHEKGWAGMVSTPVTPMFQKSDSGNVGSKGPGLAAINISTLNLLAMSGLSDDAQLLAVRLVMGGILQPADISSTILKQESAHSSRSTGKGRKPSHGDWRSPSRSKDTSSTQRSGNKTSMLKSRGSKGSEVVGNCLDSTSNEPARLKDYDLELLNDVAAWLRSLRLHKYTPCFEGMTWQEMVVMDDAGLEEKGVAALGARRRLLRTFDSVRRGMGVQLSTDSPMPTTASSVPSSASTASANRSSYSALNAPQKAAPRLSADSPVFTPTGKIPQRVSSFLQPVIV